MIDENSIKILKQAINKYGAKMYEYIAIKEMSELIKALLKYRRAGKNNEYNLRECENNIIEEITDVKISMVYLELIYEKICPDFSQRIDKAMKCKIDRTAERYLREDD